MLTFLFKFENKKVDKLNKETRCVFFAKLRRRRSNNLLLSEVKMESETLVGVVMMVVMMRSLRTVRSVTAVAAVAEAAFVSEPVVLLAVASETTSEASFEASAEPEASASPKSCSGRQSRGMQEQQLLAISAGFFD
jgi:hypothetical protein